MDDAYARRTDGYARIIWSLYDDDIMMMIMKVDMSPMQYNEHLIQSVVQLMEYSAAWIEASVRTSPRNHYRWMINMGYTFDDHS
jgi:hypothetical protein